jgi:Adenosine specific kinase
VATVGRERAHQRLLLSFYAFVGSSRKITSTKRVKNSQEKPMPTTADEIRAAVDGFSPKGIEDEGEIKWRKDFLRQIGYKL